MLQKWIKSFWWAINGFKTVWHEENNFRIEVIIGVLILLAAAVFKFSYTEFAVIIVAIVIVLTGEIVNTAIEDLCNKVEPKHDAAIGKIKDTMAAFVLLASLGTLVLGLLTFAHHFLQP